MNSGIPYSTQCGVSAFGCLCGEKPLGTMVSQTRGTYIECSVVQWHPVPFFLGGVAAPLKMVQAPKGVPLFFRVVTEPLRACFLAPGEGQGGHHRQRAGGAELAGPLQRHRGPRRSGRRILDMGVVTGTLPFG